MNKQFKLPLLIFCCCLSGLLLGQDIPKVTSTFAIKNANVTVRPGQMIQNATILVKDGLIQQVGPSVNIPFDAEVINADSMFIYPGFIDALSHTGVKAKEEKPNPNPSYKPGNAPNDKAGITPEVKVRDVLHAKDGSVKSMRDLGFVISHVVPRGRLFAGQGSIVLLSGSNVDHMLMKENVSQFGRLQGTRGVFPATTIGAMSKFRDLYKNAELADQYQKAFALNSSGMKRPSYDAATKALIPVTRKSMPLFFYAEKSKDIHRAIQLKKELGFHMVLVEAKQIYPVMKKVQQHNLPVLLSLDLPKKEKEEKKKDKEDDKEKEEMDPEKEALKKRADKIRETYLSQAAQMEKSGVPFSFSFTKVKTKDIHSNIKRLIESGLSENGALAALTTNPAKLLGISNVTGTLERGKMANLVISDKNIFEEKSKIHYVFVEGEKFAMDIKPESKKEDGDPASQDFSGVYKYEVEIPGNPVGGTLKITKEGDDYEVVATSDQSPDEPAEGEDITIDGNKFSFSFEASNGGFTMEVEMNLEFDGDTFDGTVAAGEFGSFPASGSKTGDPDQH